MINEKEVFSEFDKKREEDEKWLEEVNNDTNRIISQHPFSYNMLRKKETV